ncbi:MAG: hypothetical protein K6B74_10380 [Ruminococcus sp.]|nr:hypothetical protein [Ruminococcus sp.]
MSKESAELRRYEDDLYICGKGAVIMGIWCVVKGVLQIFLTSIRDMIDNVAKDEGLIPQAKAIVFIFLLIMVVLMTLAHIYSGVNAMKAARGKKYRKGYLAVSVVLIVIFLGGLPFYKIFFEDEDAVYSVIPSIITDLTTVYLLAVIIKSARKIKQLKQMREES